MRYKTCPRCFRRIPAGSHCPCTPRQARVQRYDPRRNGRERHRLNYSTTEYQNARQVAIQRARGICEHPGCTVQVCYFERGRWKTYPGRGGTDHIRRLVDGGTNDPSNLRLLCSRHHAQHDAAKRRM